MSRYMASFLLKITILVALIGNVGDTTLATDGAEKTRGGLRSRIDTPTAYDCASQWSQLSVRPADYLDWKIERSQGVEASWVVDFDNAEKKTVLKIKFSKTGPANNKAQVLLKSARLTRLSLLTLNKTELRTRGTFAGRIRPIFKDSTGGLMFSKNAASSAYPGWATFALFYREGNLLYHNRDNGSSPRGPVNLDHIAIALPSGAEAGEVAFSTIAFSGRFAVADTGNIRPPYRDWHRATCAFGTDIDVDFVVDYPRMAAPFRVGETIATQVTVSDRRLRVNYSRIQINLRRFNGTEVVLVDREDAEAGTTHEASFSLPLNLPEPGLYALIVRVMTSTGKVLVQRTREIYVWRPVEAGYYDSSPTFFGMMYPIDRFQSERALDLQLMRDAGVRVVRFPFRWAEIESERAKFDWRSYDAAIADLSKHGFVSQAIIIYTPLWARREERSTAENVLPPYRRLFVVPRNPGDVARFVTAAGNRYKDYNVVWEIWNEPSEPHYWLNGGVSDYLDLLHAASTALKKVDSEARVLTAGMDIFAATDPGFMSKTAQLGVDAYDGLAVHAYGGPEQISDTLSAARRLLEATKETRAIWLNETGFLVDPSDPFGEIQRAEILVKSATVARFEKAANFTWFVLRNNAASALTAMDNYALIDQGGRARLPLVAYANVVRWLADTKPKKRVSISKGLSGYLFEHPSRMVLVTWPDDSAELVAFAPPVVAGGRLDKMYDVFGGLVELNADGAIEKTHTPVFIVYKPDQVGGTLLP